MLTIVAGLGCAVFVIGVIAIIAIAIAIRASNRAGDAVRELDSLRRAFERERMARAVRPESPPQPPPAPQRVPPVAAPPVEAPAASAPIAEPEPAPPQQPPTPTPPPPPPPPSPRRPFDWESLIGVKLFSWIAGIALVLAALFFLSYSVEHGWLNPPVRASLGMLAGIAMLVVCELRVARGYAFTANAIDGAGIAILYATLFATYALWHLLPAGVVFAAMLVVTAIAVLLSIRRDSVFIALLGLLGGFATPALLSSGENKPVALFSYLLLLNVRLTFVAIRKRWPLLSALSVVFTVIYQWSWIGSFMTASQVPLAVGIFLMFAAAAAPSLWMRRSPDAEQRRFDLVGISAAGLPLLFAFYVAGVSSYGVQFNVLFTFLLLVTTGLSVIAIVRGPQSLHLVGGLTIALVLAVWRAVSYTPRAWPAVLAWIAAFVVVHLVLSRFTAVRRLTVAPLFLIIFATLTAAPSPPLLFGLLWVLVALIAGYAILYDARGPFSIAALIAIATQLAWCVDHLATPTLTLSLVVFGAFALLFAAKTLFDDYGDYFALSGYLFLIITASQRALLDPPLRLLFALLVTTIGIAAAALYRRRPHLMSGAMAGAQVVLIIFGTHALDRANSQVAFAAAIGTAALAVIWFLVDRRFMLAAFIALFLGEVVVIVANAFSPATLYGSQLLAHLLILAGILAVAWIAEAHVAAVLAVPLLAVAAFLSGATTPGRQLAFAASIYALFLAYPLLLGARIKQRIEPHLAAVLAGIPFFFLARSAIRAAGYGSMIGLLPLLQAAVTMILLWQLLRTEPAGARMLSRLALVAAAVLAFITVAIPLQLHNEWVTLGWALEAAALVWLYRRIPHGGLLAWSNALFIAVFVRLVLNPNVFAYHPVSHTPIVNWYLYTYVVAAAAFFAGTTLLSRDTLRMRGALAAGGTILLFVVLNIEIADYYSTGRTLTFNFFSSSLAQDLTYTIGWAVFAVAMLITGLALHNRPARVAAIVLLLVTVLKCFLHDLARLGGLYRVGSLLGLALSLVLVGVLLQKFVLARAAAPEPETM